jgi:hypothetical protein
VAFQWVPWWLGCGKALVGQFDDAWARMLVSYDRNSEWSLEECTTKAPLDKCPVGFKKRASFHQAVALAVRPLGVLFAEA